MFLMERMPKAASVYFTFCGINSADIKLAIEMGVVTENTLIVVVEREARAAAEIEKYLETLPNEYYLHNRDLRYFRNLEKVLDGKEIDAAFFDFCGVVDEVSTKWIVDNAHHFAHGCMFGYTVSSNYRVAPFMDTVRSRFLPKHGVSAFCRRALNNIRHSVDASNYDYDDPKRRAILNRRNDYLWLSCKIVALMFGVKTELFDIYSYRDTKHGMNIIIGKVTGKVRQKPAIKFADFLTTLRPKRRVKRSKKILSLAEKHQAFVRSLVAAGVKHNGQIRVTGGQKARMSKLAHDLGKSVVHCWSGVKIVVKKQTGKSATIITLPNKKR
jgi:hypothetical protein